MVVTYVNAVGSCHVGKGDNLKVQAYQIDVTFLLRGVPGQEFRAHDASVVSISELDVKCIGEGNFHVVLK